jgi:hypothetical protein
VKSNHPNYSLTPQDVYLHFATSLVNYNDKLDTLLSWCSYNPTSLNPRRYRTGSKPIPRIM